MPLLATLFNSITTSGRKWGGQGLRLNLPRAGGILHDCENTYYVRRSSTISIPKPLRTHTPELPFEDDPSVLPNSLRDTLEAHREANRASLIRKIDESGRKIPLALESHTSRDQDRPPKRLFEPKLHLKVKRVSKSERRKLRQKYMSSDYEGQSRGLTTQWIPSHSSSVYRRMPWWKRVCLAQESASTPQLPASEQLAIEILAFDAYNTPTPDELAAAESAISDLRAHIASIDSSVKLDVVGSRGNGLATPLSDVDVNLTPANRANSTGLVLERKQANELLERLWSKIASRKDHARDPLLVPIYSSKFVEAARVPIVAGIHAPTNLQFQIQCTSECFNSMEYAKSYAAEYPTLRPLYIVLKQMLDIRGLSTGYMGGIGSYPLLIMIVAALKFSEGKIGRREAGKQLMFFLDMYSKIDLYTTGVSLSPLGYVVKRQLDKTVQRRLEKAPTAPDQGPHASRPIELSEDDLAARRWFCVLHHSEPYLMCLQDPSNPTNDLGRGVKLIKHVQAVFVEASRRLSRSIEDWEATDWKRTEQTAGAKSKLPMLDWCLGADYKIFEHERGQLRAVGKGLRQFTGTENVDKELKIATCL